MQHAHLALADPTVATPRWGLHLAYSWLSKSFGRFVSLQVETRATGYQAERPTI